MSVDEGLQHWALQKDQDQDGEADNDVLEGLTIQKSVLIDAWATYRLFKHKKEQSGEDTDEDKDDSPDHGIGEDHGEDEISEEADMMEGKQSILAAEHHIFEKSFINYLMSEIHLKIYDYTETDEQNERKKQFKEFIKAYKEIQANKILKESMEREKLGLDYVEKVPPIEQLRHKVLSKEEISDLKEEETDGIQDQVSLLDDFLSCFIWPGDSGKKIDQIDIILALKSLPEKVDDSNLARCELFNYGNTNTSIIAFNNNDQDELFKYYDNRNKKRLNKLSKKATKTQDLTNDLMDIAERCQDVMKDVQNTGSLRDTHKFKLVDEGDKYMDMLTRNGLHEPDI